MAIERDETDVHQMINQTRWVPTEVSE